MKLSIVKIKYLLLFVFFFQCIYSLKFSFFYSSNLSIVLVIFLISYKNLFKDFCSLNRPFLIFYLLILASVIISAVSSFLNQGDYYESKNIVTGLILSYLGLLIVKSLVFANNKDEFEIFFIKIVILQAILSMFYFFSSSFATFTNNILPGNLLLENSLVKIKGFTNTGAFGLNVIQLLGFLLCFKHFMETRKINLFFLLGSIIIFISILLTGRTGIFLALFFVLLRCLVKPNLNLFWLFLMIFFLLIGSIIFSKFFSNSLSSQFNLIYNYGLEFIIKGGESSSTDQLKNMYVFPKLSTYSWLIGDGFRYNSAGAEFGFYKDTDVGYFRNLYATGVLGCFFIYSSVIYLYFKIIKITKKFNDRFFINYLTLCIFILEGKGEVIPFGIGGFFLSYILIMFCYYYKNSSSSEKLYC